MLSVARADRLAFPPTVDAEGGTVSSTLGGVVSPGEPPGVLVGVGVAVVGGGVAVAVGVGVEPEGVGVGVVRPAPSARETARAAFTRPAPNWGSTPGVPKSSADERSID